MPDALAHIDEAGRQHDLRAHLSSVAALAADFGVDFGTSDWARLAGLWHDLGKYRAGFQRYICGARDPDAHVEGKIAGPEKTHSAAGALWAQQYLKDALGPQGQVIARVLSYVIAGHHAGLDNWHDGLKARFALESTNREFEDALVAEPPIEILRPGFPMPDPIRIPSDTKTRTPGSFALWVRMLFSALVDADFLDTEAFMDERRSSARQGQPTLGDLDDRFERHIRDKLEQLAVQGEEKSPVNRMRAAVLEQCRDKAKLGPGVFTLTVPTGGGKTLSSLAFALRHAASHGKRRIVYAIPYTSIIEQTADVFSGIFGQDNVVEHHSNAESSPERETQRSRLACENWDAPLVVTTNVQLFESLFARRTSRCRKLHNLTRSVIVLDEAQLLPVDFLQPILDVLRLLVSDYGVTLVLCTATQPALARSDSFDPARRLRGFDAREITEIIDDIPTLYRALRRVEVHRPRDMNAQQAWPDVASEIAAHEAVLAIVNRRADARELFSLLRTDYSKGLFHLSALMCAQHRSDTLTRIRSALSARRGGSADSKEEPPPVRVVSTQLVEAGVDIDFPVVYRAMAGLDSIAQAAGRCNREGRLDRLGQVRVFVPPTRPPPGLLRQAEAECRVIWSRIDPGDDAIDVSLYPDYFRRLYARDLDTKRICEALTVGRAGDVRFRDAADAFRLIDDKDGVTVIVRYSSPTIDEDVNVLLGMLEADGPQRWLMRKLQRYGVTVYRHDADRLLRQGDIRCVDRCPGLYVQASDVFYDPMLGALVDGAPGDPAAFVV
jgi:CRISPR-associated endonuclease/helicase Cas3